MFKLKNNILFKSLVIICSIVIILFNAQTSHANDNKVIIYSSSDIHFKYVNKRLKDKFPQYEIIVEYIPTGKHAARLKAEGLGTPCDISFELDYSYLNMLENMFAPLDQYDFSTFTEDSIVLSKKYLPLLRNGGAIIINPAILEKHKLPEPTSYAELLKPEYKGLISMANPKFSGTAFSFLNKLVNIWGEAKTLNYFDALAENVLQFTSSGSGPVNSLVQGEVAIAFGMIAQAVSETNKGTTLKCLEFKEGTPSSLYGYAIIKGKEQRQAVKDVMNFIYSELVIEINNNFFPEPIFKDKMPQIINYPTNLNYAKMNIMNPEEKQRLLEMWPY